MKTRPTNNPKAFQHLSLSERIIIEQSYIILKLVAVIILAPIGLNTILFYIILKRISSTREAVRGLNTILFYIILKPQIQK